MKGLAIKIFSALLLVWYCTSVIGFDVHTCSGSGRSFVATFISGLSCEDIHPEHHCDHEHCCGSSDEEHSCCGSSDEDVYGDASCCTNDFQVLLLTGTVADDDGRQYDVCDYGCMSCADLYSEVSCSGMMPSSGHIVFKLPGSGTPVRVDAQSLFNIWRI